MGVNVTIMDLRAGSEPKMFGSEGGGKVATVSGAHNEKTTNSAGVRVDETTWMPVKAFGAAATFLEKYVHTGTRFLVNGSLHNRTYETDGQKHTVTEIHVIPGRGSIELLDAVGSRQDRGGDVSPAA